jgi:hypothetical protein
MKITLQQTLLYRTAFFLFSFCSCFIARAQVTPVGTPASANQNNTIASFTVPAGNKRLLIVTASDGGTITITGATFNGVPMVKRKQVDDGFISCDAIFTLSLGDGATAITGSVVFTSPNPSNVTKFVSAAAFTKVNQVTPFSDIKSGLANLGSSSLTVAGTAGDLVFDIFDSWNAVASGAQVPGSGQSVANSSGALNFGAGNGFGFYSTGRKAGAASVSTSWNAAGHSAYIHIAVNIAQDNIVLPLKLLSFTGTQKDNDAMLNWLTADEINIAHTEVQRSTDGTDFSMVTNLDKTVKSYADINALEIINSKLFYRLKLVDLDGNFNYSPVVIVQAQHKTSFITGIQPLLTSGKIAVSFDLPQAKNATLQLCDIAGNTIRKTQLGVNKGTSTRYMENLQSLPGGVYVFQVLCGEERLMQKFIK